MLGRGPIMTQAEQILHTEKHLIFMMVPILLQIWQYTAMQEMQPEA